MNLTDTIAEVVRNKVCCTDSRDAAYWYFEDSVLKEIGSTVASAVQEACTIRTVNELNAHHLSAWGTLIVELHHPDDGCSGNNCWIVPVVWEMVNQMGWMCHTYRPEGAQPHLPARVIWHPDWEAKR